MWPSGPPGGAAGGGGTGGPLAVGGSDALSPPVVGDADEVGVVTSPTCGLLSADALDVLGIAAAAAIGGHGE